MKLRNKRLNCLAQANAIEQDAIKRKAFVSFVSFFSRQCGSGYFPLAKASELDKSLSEKRNCHQQTSVFFTMTVSFNELDTN